MIKFALSVTAGYFAYKFVRSLLNGGFSSEEVSEQNNPDNIDVKIL